ncbi:MAG: pilus assembly protein TadG-related protein [Anaerolineae bacterium]
MESVRFDKERGQILVQVALMVVVLFAFVALALDVGHVYAGRRRMQNAADSAALAGAREICFGGYESLNEARTAAEVAAKDYAERNGAPDPDVEVMDDHTVVVTAGQTLDTFFAGVIGITSADVRAEAAARCGPVSAAGGSWPLAFDYATFTDTVECNGEFMVFDDGRLYDKDDDGEYVLTEDCAQGCECATDEDLDEGNPCYDKCNCALFGPPIAPGDYGWLDFPRPEDVDDPYPVPENCVVSSGEKWVECWIEHDFPVRIEVGDCVRGESGVMSAIEDDVNARKGDYVTIILWDRECGEDDPEPLGKNGTPYRVAGFGCIEILEYTTVDIFQCGIADPAPKHRCYNDVKVIRARRVCDGDPDFDECRSVTGSTPGSGDPSQPWTVSLIQWPPPADE